MKIRITILFYLISHLANAQLTLTGKVVDAQNNPMPFVNLFIQGTNCGTTTENNGNFSLKPKKLRGVLVVSFVGYKSKTIKFNKKEKPLHIILTENDNVLEEIVIVTKPKKRLKKKENPAYKILKEIWKRKRKNNLDLANYYQYKEHTTTEIGLNNLDTTFIKTVFREEYKSTLKKIQHDSDGVNYYIPLYINERITNWYINNKTRKSRADIEAEQEQGIETQGFVIGRITNTFKEVDVFKNNITIGRKSFVSPLSTKGFASYDYVLYDSIVKNNKKLYNIYFFPRGNQDLAFKGNFWVADKIFSIKKIKMKVTKEANLNFVRGLRFEKEFELYNDSIYIPTVNNFTGDFTVLDKKDKNKGFTVKKNIYYSNYKINKAMPDNFYEITSKKTRPNQYAKDTTYWSNIQTKNNKKTYKIIKIVKNKRNVRNLTNVINTVTSGYIRVAKDLQIGPFWTAFGKNEIEGFKTTLAFRTFRTKDDRFRLSGHITYGFGDKKLKYGAEVKYLLSYKPRITTILAHYKDINQLGTAPLNKRQSLGRPSGNVALLSMGVNYFLSAEKKHVVNFDYAIHNNFHFGFNLSHTKIASASPEKFSMSYKDTDGIIKDNVIDTASNIYLTITPGRIVHGLGVDQAYGRNIFPTIKLNYQHGYKGFLNGTHTYKKLKIKYSQPLLLGKIGLLDATIQAGKTFGTVPISLLSPIHANQSYSLTKNTFSLINYYDFVTDTYAAGHFEHHFNGFILNKIPLIKKLKLRSLLTFRTAYGTISKENRAINDSITNSYGTKNLIYNAPNKKIYYEYGFGLENIGYGNLRFLRLDAIWRSQYKPLQNNFVTPTPKFAIRVGVKVSL